MRTKGAKIKWGKYFPVYSMFNKPAISDHTSTCFFKVSFMCWFSKTTDLLLFIVLQYKKTTIYINLVRKKKHILLTILPKFNEMVDTYKWSLIQVQLYIICRCFHTFDTERFAVQNLRTDSYDWIIFTNHIIRPDQWNTGICLIFSQFSLTT